jgi:hypothetical protein
LRLCAFCLHDLDADVRVTSEICVSSSDSTTSVVGTPVGAAVETVSASSMTFSACFFWISRKTRAFSSASRVLVSPRTTFPCFMVPESLEVS